LNKTAKWKITLITGLLGLLISGCMTIYSHPEKSIMQKDQELHDCAIDAKFSCDETWRLRTPTDEQAGEDLASQINQNCPEVKTDECMVEHLGWSKSNSLLGIFGLDKKSPKEQLAH
jgi:hypothetical protein